jgi:hypothetical protein
MDELQKLYDLLVEKGYFTQDYDAFKTKFKDAAYQEKVYGVLNRDGLYTKPKTDFTKQYLSAMPATPQVAATAEDPSKKKVTTALPSAGGSLVSPTKLPNFVEEQLAAISPDLIDKGEEYVVPQLRYQFGPMGFKFDEAVPGRDFVDVTAPNGKKARISLDNWTTAGDKEESEALRKFLRENSATINNLQTLEKEYTTANKKYTTEKEVEDVTKKMQEEEYAFRLRTQELLKRKKEIEAEENAINSTPSAQRNNPAFQERFQKLNENKLNFNKEVTGAMATETDIKNRMGVLNQAVGKYTEQKAQQGTWYGGIANAFLDGAASISSTAFSLITNLEAELLPKEMLMGRDEYRAAVIEKAKRMGYQPPRFSLGELKSQEEFEAWKNKLPSGVMDDIDDEVEDEAKKAVLYGEVNPKTGKREGGWLEPIRKGNRIVYGDSSTTTQWEDLKNEGFWGGAVLGLAKSVPAMMGGSGPVGWAQRTAQMYAQVSDNLNEEMANNPEFDNISENEKLAVTLPIGAAVGTLEAIGFRNVLANKGLLNGLVVKALGKAGGTTSARTFNELIKNEVKSGLARGTLVVVGGALAEAETGAAQELAESGLKDVYNAVKGKQMFETPESVMDYVRNAAYAGAQEAVGGAIIGTLPGFSAAYRKQGFLGMSDTQFELFEAAANDTKIEKAFIISLQNKVNTGELTMAEAKETLNDYRNAVGLFNSLPPNLDLQGKKEAMNLLKEKRDLERQIDGKDEALTVPQRERVKAINEQLTKISQDAIQKQAAGQVSVQPTPGDSEALAQGEPKTGLEVITQEGEKVLSPEQQERKDALIKALAAVEDDQETITIGDQTIAVDEALNELDALQKVSSKTRVNVAPFFNTQVGSTSEAAALRESPAYKGYLQTLADIGSLLGIKTNVLEFIGGYENNKGERIVEISNAVDLEGATIEQAEEYAALVSAFAPQVQEAAIAAQYTEQGGKTHNANEYSVKVSDVDGAIDALKEAGITDFSINEKTGEVSFIDVLDFADPQLQKNIGTFVELLKSKGINYEQQDFRPVDSRRVGVASRKKILGRIKAKGSELGPSGQNILQAVEEAVRRDAEFQGVDSGEYFKPSPGNRLFNKPLERVAQIADRYYQRVFGKKRPRYNGSQRLDEARARRIANAFAAMQHNPTDPQVRAAYEAMAKETLDQYQDFLDAGYVVEINNEEPYANSQEMIDDLRNNQRMKIFSTESGFGDAAITEEQRAENPLLRDSGFKDVNGQTMLVNDVFRAIHDFFGHAELGNSFGPKGEENAWNVHARMYSPLARAAMTTETRGQNSYVNFSGENEALKELRQQARALREEGLNSQARKIEEQIYEKFKFADQKIGLLPAEFYEINETDTGDIERAAPTTEELMTADTKDATTLERVKEFLDKVDGDLTKFGRETAGINIAIPVMKAIIKTVKALVATGITLQEAITRAAAQNNVSEQDVIDSISALAQQRDAQAQPEDTTEMELPGFNRMMTELEGVVRKSLQRGNTNEEAMQNAIAYLQGSRVYETASDTQREKMVRDIRKRFGKREKAAPKPQKLFGETKDVNEITMSEYELLKKQLADQAKGAKDAIKLWVRTSGELVKYLRTMTDKGFITAKQTAAIISKFSGVNMFDPNSIGRFVDYMAKVFKNANYADQIGTINKALPTARRNAQTKIGIAESLSPLMQRLLAIKPTLIPDAVFEKYTKLVTMMGERRAVLQLEEINAVTKDVNDILNAVDADVSLAAELAERFNSYDGKLVDDEGKVDYAGTIRDMVKDEVITEEEAEIMRKYKSSILPMTQKDPRSEAEIEAENQVMADAAQLADLNPEGLPTADERNLARELKKLLKTDAVYGLDNAQLKNLLRLIDNINNGYLPHYTQLIVERMNAINKSKTLNDAVQKAKPLKLSSIYSKIKGWLTKKDGLVELIRRNPLYYIDQVFGNYNTKEIFNSLFAQAADAQAKFQKAVTELNNKLDRAQEAVAKSFKNDANKTLMSKFKMMTYMVQLEHDSNPDSKQVNPAAEYLKKTIDHIRKGKSSFGERDADMLQEIYDEYTDANGNIDNQKLYDSFNEAERNAIKTIQKVNEDLREKAVYTAAIVRGDKITPLNNYVHLNTLHEHRPDEAISGVAFIDSYNESMRPSTKAKSLIARTGKVAPLNFDVFASANRGAKFVLMDYYLTEPIRTGRKTINETSKLMEQEGATKQQQNIFNAIERVYEEAVDNLLTDNFTSTSLLDDAVNFMSKQGYRAVLASAPRFVGELSSNIAFAMIAAPKDFKAGLKNRGVVLSPTAATIMSNVGSKQTNRLFPHDTLSGRLIDASIMNQASGVKGGRAQNDVRNKIQQIYNISLKKYQNAVETMADALIATPDKMVMRPMWFGAFANEFKKITGAEPDFDKIAENDERYMASNKEALDAAKNYADEKTVLTGATDNAFMGILKGTPKQNQSALIRGFNIFNNFMTRFLIYEYITARTGINAAMGNGTLSRKTGVALLAAVATRMTAYTLITQALSSALVGLFVPDEDEDDEKSIEQKIGQGMLSSATSLLLGRDFGNATKNLIGYGVERVNENYLDFLREGEYDPYKDALQYTVIPAEKKGKKTDMGDLLMNMLGPFGPSAKTLDLMIRKATEEPKKQADAIQRSEKEVGIRIPLEIMGNLGLIPLYKDVRKIVNKELYKDLEKAEVTKPMNKIGKEDMKRYYPEMYEDLYGEGGVLYDIEKMKSEMRKEKERIRREIKDEMYEYVPKQSGGNTIYGKEKQKK